MVFYAYWSIPHAALMLVSIAVNYFFGYAILHRAKATSKISLVCGLSFNLLFLGVFKYLNFALENINALLGSNMGAFYWILPLGISFYTFQQMSYLLDLHKGLITESQALKFATYVCFFPQLVAGPIVRYTDISESLSRPWGGESDGFNRCKGLFIFALGCSKKLFIADNIAPYVDTWHKALLEGYQPALLEAWAMAFSYPFQLYFDFSGYSDMAVGLALMFGVNVPYNFNAPFKAKNISDFWQRWHISLSQCFQRYLFTPLAMGLRHQNSIWAKQVLPFMLTMTLIGFWHGAGWTFIIWGFCHGVFLTLAYLWKTSKLGKKKMLGSGGAWALTFFAVMLVFVWFRAENVASALALFKGLFGLNGLVLPKLFSMGQENAWLRTSYYLFPALHDYRTWDPLLALIPAMLLAQFAPTTQAWADRFRLNRRAMLITTLLLILCLIKINKVSVFLYYQF